LRLRPLAFATILVWRLRTGVCGVGARGFWRLWQLPEIERVFTAEKFRECRLSIVSCEKSFVAQVRWVATGPRVGHAPKQAKPLLQWEAGTSKQVKAIGCENKHLFGEFVSRREGGEAMRRWRRGASAIVQRVARITLTIAKNPAERTNNWRFGSTAQLSSLPSWTQLLRSGQNNPALLLFPFHSVYQSKSTCQYLWLRQPLRYFDTQWLPVYFGIILTHKLFLDTIDLRLFRDTIARRLFRDVR